MRRCKPNRPSHQAAGYDEVPHRLEDVPVLHQQKYHSHADENAPTYHAVTGIGRGEGAILLIIYLTSYISFESPLQ